MTISIASSARSNQVVIVVCKTDLVENEENLVAEQAALKAAVEPLAVEAGLDTVAAVLLLEVSTATAAVAAYRTAAAALEPLAAAERR